MSTSTTPDIELTVTDNAAVEVRKFMEAEGVTGELGGLPQPQGQAQTLEVAARLRAERVIP